MPRIIRKIGLPVWAMVGGFLLFYSPAQAQSTQSTQFWPEVDFYKKLDTYTRFYFMVKGTRDDGEGTGLEAGPSMDFYLPPMLKLRNLARLGVDESESRPVMFRIGYRYLPSVGSPAENRAIVELTPRLPFVRGVVLSDRNRADFRFINGTYSWRYRNRLSIERAFPIRSQAKVAPFARAEAYYDSQYQKWNRTALDAGVDFSFAKHWELQAYYEHDNNTGKHPNQQTNGLGLLLGLHF